MDVPPPAEARLCLVPDSIEFGLCFKLEIRQRALDVGDGGRVGVVALPVAREREMAREALVRGRASVRPCVDGGERGKVIHVRCWRELHALWTSAPGGRRRDRRRGCDRFGARDAG